MPAQAVLWPLGDDQGQARNSDPATSHEAAQRIRTGTAKAALLNAHYTAWKHYGANGLTDEEAAEWADLSPNSEYATRCSELMRAGLLADTDRTRLGSSGMHRLVRVITPAGRRVAEGLV